jgi:hypothetical protein
MVNDDNDRSISDVSSATLTNLNFIRHLSPVGQEYYLQPFLSEKKKSTPLQAPFRLDLEVAPAPYTWRPRSLNGQSSLSVSK